MRVVLDILLDGKNMDKIYNLPCVMSVTKDADGKPAAILGKSHTKGRTIARLGDHICQFESGLWQVFGTEAAGRIKHGGAYRNE